MERPRFIHPMVNVTLAAAMSLSLGVGRVEAAGFDISFDRGERKQVPTRCAISGDVRVDGKDVFDHDALSALIVETRRSALIEAPFGASGRCFDNDRELADWITGQEDRNLSNGFARTDHVVISSSSVVDNQETTGTCTGDIQMGRRETRTVPAGSVGKGDVKVNGEALYDDRDDTGLVFVLTKDAEVEAPWGANIQVIKECFDGAEEARNRVIRRFRVELGESGCDRPTGCDRVDVVFAPGGRQGKSLAEEAIAKAQQRFNGSWAERVNPTAYVSGGDRIARRTA